MATPLPMPAEVVAVLQSVNIVPTPPVKQPGDPLDLKLQPEAESLPAMLGGSRTLANINVEALLDRITLTALPPVWAKATWYALGSVIRATESDVERYYVCTVAGESGTAPPSFPSMPDETVSEGPSDPQLTWRAARFPGGIELNPGRADLTASLDSVPLEPPTWKPNETYDAGQVVQPTTENGRYYVCTVPGKSGGSEPFPLEPGDPVEEGPSNPPLQWRAVPIDTNLVVDLDAVAGERPLGTTNLDVNVRAVEGKPRPGTADLDLDMEGIQHGISGTVKPVEQMTGTASGTVAQAAGMEGAVTGRLQQFERTAGTIQGTVGQLTTLVGSIVGTLRGSITEGLLPGTPQVAVGWHVEDQDGTALRHGDDFLIKGVKPDDDPTKVAEALSAPSLSIAFLPQFEEYTGIDPGVTTKRRIWCEVEASLAEFKPETVQTPPVFVDVPKIQVPTVVAMTERPLDAKGASGGRVLVAVPKSSPFPDVGGVVRRLELVLPVAVGVVRGLAGLGLAKAELDGLHYPALVDTLHTLIGLVRGATIPPSAWVKEDRVHDLWWVGSSEWVGGGIVYYPWEDIISGLVMVGPPGRQLTCHVEKSLYEKQGAFRITLDFAGAVVPNLGNPAGPASGSPPVPDLRATNSTIELAAGWAPAPRGNTFNDNLSSYMFSWAGKLSPPM
jgi:hypothetical protein